MVIAPVFLNPPGVLTLAGGYAAGLVVPVASAVALAPSFLTLNVASLLGMGFGTFFMNRIGIPYLLQKRGATDAILALSSSAGILMSSSILCSAFLLLATVNAHVLYIENYHRTQRLDTEKKWYVLDGTDEVANGIIMAGYTGFTFYRILRTTWAVAKQLVYPSSDKKNLAEQLLDME